MNITKFLEEVNGEKFYPLNFSVVQNGEFLELVLEYDGKPSVVVFSAMVGEEDEIMSWLQDKINRTQIMVFNFWAEMHRQSLMPNKKRIFMDSFEFSQWEDEFSKKLKGHFSTHTVHINVNNVVTMCHDAYVHTEEGVTLCICSTTSHDRLREICEEWLANPANSEFLAV